MVPVVTEIGRVVAVNRFPVKSMGGEALAEIHLGWQGFEGDRRFAFLRANNKSGLPWLSARQLPALIAYRAMIVPGDGRRDSVLVHTPSGARYDVGDADLLAELAELTGEPLQLVQQHRGAFDAMPLSVVTAQSIATISAEVGAELDARRFRTNIVVEAFASRTFPEEKWIGQTLHFGAGSDPARVRLNRKPLRCSIVNVNPDTGREDVAVHRAIVARRRNELGAWGTPERTGSVTVDDIVYTRG